MPVFRALLEPDAVKVARPILRGEGSGNAPDLPDPPLVHEPEVMQIRSRCTLLEDAGKADSISARFNAADGVSPRLLGG